tara:strand:- start:935 stop:1363 length:429 start_codon:yes stop_codon:yes gene_type:complete
MTLNPEMAINNSSKIANKFHCEKCEYTCNKNSEYNKHLSTKKHQILQNPIHYTKQTFTCKCGKEYKHSSTLYHHKKKCSSVQEEEILKTDNIPTTDIDKDVLIKMLLKNQDIMEGVILKNTIVMDKLIEMMPNMGMNTNSNK